MEATMSAAPHGTRWIRFENIDGRVIDEPTLVTELPEVGQLIPVAGTHCEVMERWVDRELVTEGGPEIVVFTVRPLV
jgi:hypothetical protein